MAQGDTDGRTEGYILGGENCGKLSLTERPLITPRPSPFSIIIQKPHFHSFPMRYFNTQDDDGEDEPHRGPEFNAPPPPYGVHPGNDAGHAGDEASHDMSAPPSPFAFNSTNRGRPGSTASNSSFGWHDAYSSGPGNRSRGSRQSSYDGGSEYDARQGLQGQLEQVAQDAVVKGMDAAIAYGCERLARRHPRLGELVMDICSQLTASSDEPRSPQIESFMTGRSSSGPGSFKSSRASSSW